MTRPPAVPARPGLYLDAAGEVWRARPGTEPSRPVTFDELLHPPLIVDAPHAARYGPFTPLLPLTDARRLLIVDALLELQALAEDHAVRRHDHRTAAACRDLLNEIEDLA